METQAETIDTSWIGTLVAPAGSPKEFERASDLIASEWYDVFTAWLQHRVRQGGGGRFGNGLVVDINWLVEYRTLFGDMKRIGAQGLDDQGRTFMEMYQQADASVSKHIPEFRKDVEDAAAALAESPSKRIIRQGSTILEQLEFHKQNLRTAQAYTVQYSELAARLGKVPDEVLKHVVRAKKLSLLGRGDEQTALDDDGIHLKKKELALFKELVPIAKELEAASRAQAATLQSLYKETPGGVAVWYAYPKLTKDNMPPEKYAAFPGMLDAWYDEVQKSMERYQQEAKRLAALYDKTLTKIAAQQSIKFLNEVEPNYAGAALALHGLAAGTGVMAATSSVFIGPFAILIGAAAAGIEKAAVKVERKGAVKAVKRDESVQAFGVTHRVKRTGALGHAFKGAKGTAAGVNGVEKAATEVEQWVLAAQVHGDTAAQLAAPVGDALGHAGVPLSAISNTLAMAIKAYDIACDKKGLPKFAKERVQTGVGDVVHASQKHKRQTHHERAEQVSTMTVGSAKVLRNARQGARLRNAHAGFRTGEILVETHLAALASQDASPQLVEVKEASGGRDGRKDTYVFDSFGVECQEGGGGIGKYTLTGIVKRVRWACTAEGKLLGILEVDHDWHAPKSHELAHEFTVQIMNADGFREIVRTGLANGWVLSEPDSPGVYRGHWTSDVYGPVVDDACNKWNIRQLQLLENYGLVAEQHGIDLTGCENWHRTWSNVRDAVWQHGMATEIQGSGVTSVWGPKDANAADLVKLQIAYFNRANGHKDLECSNDDFTFFC